MTVKVKIKEEIKAETIHQEHPFLRTKIKTDIKYKEKRNAINENAIKKLTSITGID